MNLQEFRDLLEQHPGRRLRIAIDADWAIADHFHVTEVGRVEKQFVDCGGTRRSSLACVMQTLVADDTDHRLTTDKLARILSTVDALELPGDAPVEVEHQERSICTDTVVGYVVKEDLVEFRLAPKHTACLAEDACGIPSPAGGLSVLGDDCCGGSSGCC